MNLIAQHQLNKASQIYYCVVKSVNENDNQCTIVFNNKQYNVPYYGGKPTPNKTYAIFLPHNNMNESFIIGDGKDGGIDGEVVPISKGGTGANNIQDAVVNLEIVNFIYPVGSIYMSVNNINPATLFGGNWEQIQDTFLLAAGQNYIGGSTGGEATHTLTVNEMPSHGHDGLYWGVDYKNTPYPWGLNNDGVGNGFSSTYSDTRGGPNDGHAMYTGENGGGQPHNNMPPYLVVYIWKRVS